MKFSHACAYAAATLVSLGNLPCHAQSAPVAHEAGVVATACLNNWQAPGCLEEVSKAAMVQTVNYTDALTKAGHPADADTVKQHCAASTAAMHETVPANAMRSALTECANTISDVSQKTGVLPDPSQYQLLVGPALCLANDQRCAVVNQGLRAFVGK